MLRASLKRIECLLLLHMTSFLSTCIECWFFQRINHLKIFMIRKAAFFFLKMKKSLKVLMLRLDIS